MHQTLIHTVLRYRPRPSSWFFVAEIVKTFGSPTPAFFIPRSVSLEVTRFDSESRFTHRFLGHMQLTLPG